MDARRHLIGTAAALLAATAGLAPPAADAAVRPHGARAHAPSLRPVRHRASPDRPARAPLSGPTAIAEANRLARVPSSPGRFLGGLQVFDYAPGRTYEVWAAPLRVTTLTLPEGETVTSLAAGDTVRWQIGQTSSGEAATRQVHILVKPLQRELATNLVISTSRRLYVVALRSGPAASFNSAVAWAPDPPPPAARPEPPSLIAALPLDAGYRIKPRGRRPAWTPVAVMTDGVHTLILFPAALAHHEAPTLFMLSPSGEAQLVNYRQQGATYVIDRVLDAAELRLGERRPQIVQIRRLAGARL